MNYRLSKHIETISTQKIYCKMSKELEGEMHLQMSPCQILQIDQALGGYSHRERYRAPDKLSSQKYQKTQQRTRKLSTYLENANFDNYSHRERIRRWLECIKIFKIGLSTACTGFFKVGFSTARIGFLKVGLSVGRIGFIIGFLTLDFSK